ncbi:acyl-CoA dehydrogenase family protein [Desulfosporosinus sp. PR]|uniref:acyl-CoA dehydrogenase family protein n=1 Tax=Candidatus Desulfosporosinus nitrosoreducens TaxID=3401928 RepID=UPI0027F87AFE|nr:acyl-CoA dehydrogenase family protein [Desulfosporosinus sp. PR]MDQ7093218.1 acyl-CoA dehydrogenase family protein [Desulfosporosinus sp. PR]
MISFELTDEQKELQAMVRKFTKNEIIPVAAAYDQKSEMPWPIIQKGFEIGLWNFNLPQKYNGLELDHVTEAILIEELAYGCLGISGAWDGNTLALTPILIAGSEEQQDRWLPQFAEKPLLGAFCLTEPGAGSDVKSMVTRAEKVGDEYIINGSKCFITHGGIASMYTVFAKMKGTKKISAFLVSGDNPSVSMGKVEDKLGDRASHIAEVIFEDVRVPAKDLLGQEGDGFKIAMQTLDRTRMSIGAAAVGVARRALEESIEYAKVRTQFGKPIGQHQGIAFMLADMATKVEAARSLVLLAASEIDAKRVDPKFGAMCKLYAADIAMEVTVDAIQIHGGYGYMRDYPVEKLMRDAKILQIYEGTQQVQRMVIAGRLLS